MRIIIKSITFKSVDDVKQFLFRFDLFNVIWYFFVFFWAFLNFLYTLFVQLLLMLDLFGKLIDLILIVNYLLWVTQSSVLKISLFLWSKVKIYANNCAYVNYELHCVYTLLEPTVERFHSNFCYWTSVPKLALTYDVVLKWDFFESLHAMIYNFYNNSFWLIMRIN